MSIFKEIQDLAENHGILIDYDMINKIENGQQNEVSKDRLRYSYTAYISRIGEDDFLDAVNNDELELALAEAVKMAKVYIL